MKNINNEKECCGCGCCNTKEGGSMIDIMLAGAMAALALEAILGEDDMPNASPMDLLSPSDYKQMDAYLEKYFGPFRPYIDENYVALLIALSEYEDIDMGEKIKAHLIHNLTNN